jgi:hypothetical protein
MWRLLLIISLCCFGCQKEKGDVQAPSIEAGQGLNGAAFTQGGNYTLAFEVSDDVALAQLEVSWEHHATGLFDELNLPLWSEIRQITLSGTAASPRISGSIPTDALPGLYRLQAVATDASGKKSTSFVRDFSVSNPANSFSPVLTLSSPPATGISIDAGNTLNLNGLASDDTGLRLLAIKVVRNSPPAQGSLIYANTKTTFNNPRLVAINDAINIPATQNSGELSLYIIAIDQDDNPALLNRKITIR